MKKKLLMLMIGLFLIPNIVNAYEVNVEWQNNYDVTEEDMFNKVFPMSDGGYIVFGEAFFYSNYYDDKEFYEQNDAIIVKYDKNGKLEWEKSYGGNGYDKFHSLLQTADGGFIAIGEIQASDILGITSKGGFDAIIVKFDKNGNIEWQKNYGGSSRDVFEMGIQTTDGGYMVFGTTWSTDIEGISNYGDGDAVIVKYDKYGNIEWYKHNGTSDRDVFLKVLQTTDDKYVVLLRNGGDRPKFIKIDKDGKIEWEKNYGSDSADEDKTISDMVSTVDGGFVIVGESLIDEYEMLVKFDINGDIEWNQKLELGSRCYPRKVKNTIDGGYIVFGDLIGSNKESTSVIVKYDKYGKEEWKNVYGENTSFSSLIQSADEGYVVVGSTRWINSELLPNKGGADALIVKYDKNGNIEWQKNYGGSGSDYFCSVEQIIDGGYVVVGGTWSTDIEGLTTVNGKDALIVKYNIDFELNVNLTVNGKATAEQYENGKGRINAVADEGYGLDDIKIINTKGEEIAYTEKDGYYYFDVNDDLVITVTFKELPKEVVKDERVENPKTVDMFIYYSCAIICTLFGIWSVEQYKKYKKSIE